VASDVKVLSVPFGHNAADIPFDGRAGIPYFREVSTRKSGEPTLRSILLSQRKMDYTCRRPGSRHHAERRARAGTTGGNRKAADRFGCDQLLCRPTESPMHEPSFTNIAVPGRIRFTA